MLIVICWTKFGKQPPFLEQPLRKKPTRNDSLFEKYSTEFQELCTLSKHLIQVINFTRYSKDDRFVKDFDVFVVPVSHHSCLAQSLAQPAALRINRLNSFRDTKLTDLFCDVNDQLQTNSEPGRKWHSISRLELNFALREDYITDCCWLPPSTHWKWTLF